ncbi:hypothetical protein, partial [Helicobacter sp. 13S00482-2]|uniref:hypothetical protein n=1 Tax=Helicobacter sp. 13S00482-2 TaxID=1476200 RepID=UPI0015DAE629
NANNANVLNQNNQNHPLYSKDTDSNHPSFKDILDYNNHQASLVKQEDRDNAKVMKRPLSMKGGEKAYRFFKDKNVLYYRTSKVQHQQIFFEDEEGGNIGFAAKSGISGDGVFIVETDPNVIKLYQDTDGIHYDDRIMRRAVDNVKEIFEMKKYNVLFNNCQDFTHSVVSEYYRILYQERRLR